ncbi:MAG: Acyl-CoA dehydrogenase, short-chain specific [Marmoricola sp.]|nr:Acyl-CoA dehydrogenase, short-chain specific [Marmoricola sp.]
MKFERTDEQQGFAEAIGDMLAKADTVGAARSWIDGDTAAGLGIWKRLADLGVNALLVSEEDGGLGGSLVDLAVAHEQLGYHLAVGPWIENAYLSTALAAGAELDAVAEGAVATVAVAPQVPRALDGDVASARYAVIDGTLVTATSGTIRTSIDGTRRLADVASTGTVVGSRELDAAFDAAVLATAAQLVGAGERVLADSVTYVKQRKQFGREIGSYQAIKHQLADVRIALDFARPLVHGAALGEVPASAAKAYAADAAYLAARTGLQVHGAIGYTAEFDLSLWLNRIRALVTAWGTPAFHRGRVLESLVN